MNDSESIPSLELKNILGSQEYLNPLEEETQTIPEGIFLSDTESISSLNRVEKILMGEDDSIDKDLKKIIKRKTKQKEYRKTINADPEKLAKRNKQKRAHWQRTKADPVKLAIQKDKKREYDKNYREQIKASPEKLAKRKKQRKKHDKSYYEQIKASPEKLAKRKKQKKAIATKKKTKINIDFLEDASAFLTVQNSYNKKEKTCLPLIDKRENPKMKPEQKQANAKYSRKRISK